jgi:hypothetical protein
MASGLSSHDAGDCISFERMALPGGVPGTADASDRQLRRLSLVRSGGAFFTAQPRSAQESCAIEVFMHEFGAPCA